MSILKGLRVVEISATGTAATATRHFADWGSEVIILEPPGGTPLRTEPPYYEIDGQRRSAMWQWLSRGKTALKLSHDAARSLCEDADVVIAETELTREVLGLEPAAVRPWIEGRTTFVLIAPFATDGPLADYRATDLGLMARGGWMNQIGLPDREPIRPGQGMMPRVGGVWAALTALIALRHARHGGGLQFAELSGQAMAASLITAPWLARSMNGVEAGRRPVQWPGGVMLCKDGYLGCTPLTATHWEMMCHMMGLDDVLEIPGGREPAYRNEHGDELYQRVRPWLMTQSKLELFEQAESWRIPAAPVEDVSERLVDPHLEARGFFKEMRVDGKDVKVPRVAYLIEGSDPVVRGELVETNQAPARSAPRAATPPVDASRKLPFDGIRVLDLTHFWAGPYATMLLGALGADVIKIESIQRPDAYRFTNIGSSGQRWYEWGSLWNDSNCDKRDLTLDLSSPLGKELFERLARDADLVISNFSNRVMPNLGLTPERLHEINPRIIYATLPGYGIGGPWDDYVGYGVAFEQLAVAASVTGYPDDIPRIMGGFCDPTSGLHAVIAFELALRERERTGKGTTIEIPQCEVVDSLWAPEHIAVQHGAPVPGRRANKHDWMAPHNAYRVSGNDEWVTIVVGTDAEFAALARELGQPQLASDPRFATVAARKENEAALDEAISALVRDEALLPLEARLQAAGVIACRVTKGPRLPDDAGLRHLGFFKEQSRRFSGTHPYKTWPFRFTSFRPTHKRPPPTLGQHNAEVLSSLLGLSAAEIADLEASKAIGTVPLGFEG